MLKIGIDLPIIFDILISVVFLLVSSSIAVIFVFDDIISFLNRIWNKHNAELQRADPDLKDMG